MAEHYADLSRWPLIAGGAWQRRRSSSSRRGEVGGGGADVPNAPMYSDLISEVSSVAWSAIVLTHHVFVVMPNRSLILVLTLLLMFV